MIHRPIIVCLCGSTRFHEAFQTANREETMAGRIVLTVGAYQEQDPEKKAALDQLHLQKVWLANEVLILNVGGYIGESTVRELALAIMIHRRVRFLEPEAGEKYLEDNTHALGRHMAALTEFL